LAKIVDDGPVTRMTVQRVLEQAGRAIVVAGNGAIGRPRFHAEAFDLTLLDIFMPGMDGCETMRRVLQQRPNLPIIMTSGRPRMPESSQEPDCLTELGAVQALSKPFKPATGLAMVVACFASAGPPAAPVRPDHNAVPNS